MKRIAFFAGVALLALLGPVHAEVASVSCSAGATSDLIQLDMSRFQSGVSILAYADAISGDFTIEVANDPPAEPSWMNYVIKPSRANVSHWIPHEALTAQTASALSNSIVPIQWLRANCSNVTSGSVVLSVGISGHR